MSKFSQNNITQQNAQIHSSELTDQVSSSTLESFFQKMIDNSSSELFVFEVDPNLDNPSIDLQIQGVWHIDSITFDTNRFSNIEIYFSLDGSFTDIANSPFSDATSFNSQVDTSITQETDQFYIKVGGTITGQTKVDVSIRMINKGISS